MATYNLSYICTNCSQTEESAKQLVVDGTTKNPYSFVSKYGYKFTEETRPIIRRKNASGEFYDSKLTGTITENGTKCNGTFSVSETKKFPPFSFVMSAVRDETIPLRTLNITNNVPNSTVEYEQTSETRFNIKLTCADGFTGTPQITYTDEYGSERTKEMTVSGNVATITVDIDSYTDDVTFSYKQVEPQDIPVTYYLTNCDVVGNKPDSIALNETLTVTVQATENTTLKTLQIVYNDSFGAEKTVDGEIDETGKTGVVSFTPTSTDMSYIEVRATATTSRTLNITNNIPNSTVEYEQTSETRFNIKLTCADGFTGTPQITYTDEYGSERTKEMTVSGNVATITVDIDSYTDDVTFSYKQVEPQDIPVTYYLTNCDVVGNKPDSIALNETLTVTVQATENTTLKTLQIVYNDSFGAEKTVDGEIDETGKTGVVSFTLTSTDISYIEVRATATTDEPTLKGYGAINVYKVTLDNLDEFAKKRFFTATDGTNAIVNLGDYVNRIKRVFVDVPTSGNDTLKCGNYDTKISVLSPNSDIVTIDFGNVTLTGENENSHDYETKIKLFLPFYGFVDIDSSYINKEINLTAKINIVTGNGIMQVSCDGVPFHFENVTFSRDVIYRTSDENLKLVGDDNFNELNLYGFEPYFIVESTTTVNVPINDTKEQKRIGDVTGFAQFENINLSANKNMLVDEFNEIVSQLENGVYL